MSRLKVLLLSVLYVFVSLITYGIVNIKIALKTYNLELGAVYDKRVAVFDPDRNEIVDIPIQYIWGGFLRNTPKFHPYLEKDTYVFKTIFDTSTKSTYYYDSCIEIRQNDVNMRLNILGKINILPESRNILVKYFQNVSEEYLMLYNINLINGINVSSFPWSLEATYTASKNKNNWDKGLISKILNHDEWERVNIKILENIDNIPDESRHKEHKAYGFIVPSGIEYNSNFYITKDIGLYRIWFVRINNRKLSLMENKTIVAIIKDIFKKYIESNSKDMVIYNCCIPLFRNDTIRKNVCTNADKVRYIHPISRYTIYLDFSTNLYDDLSNKILSYFNKASNEKEADIILSTYIYDSKIDEWTNMGNIFELLGLYLEPVGNHNLIPYINKKCRKHRIYPIALEKMYLITNDSLIFKFLNFNIVQGFTGLWWTCPEQDNKGE